MILQALNAYYERCENLPREGWVRRGIDYVIVLDEHGNCIDINHVGDMKKGKSIPDVVLVPAIGKQALKHSNSAKDANLLWDNASFVFGRGKKGQLKIASFLSTLHAWLGELDDVGVAAVIRFSSLMSARLWPFPSLGERAARCSERR
jgi:CRISPR-associated protein Csd1